MDLKQVNKEEAGPGAAVMAGLPPALRVTPTV